MAKFCQKCGTELGKNDTFCSNCGSKAEEEAKTTTKDTTTTTTNNTNTNNPQAKSKVAAGLLGIFLGCFGVHNFYLGYTGKAVAQLLLTLLGWILCFTGPAAAGIWGLVEGIMILTGSINTDADGNPLKD